MIDVWQDPTYDPNDNDLFSWIGQLKKPSKHSPIQNQKLKHQKKVQNMFKVNNKDTRTTSMGVGWGWSPSLPKFNCLLRLSNLTISTEKMSILQFLYSVWLFLAIHETCIFITHQLDFWSWSFKGKTIMKNKEISNYKIFRISSKKIKFSEVLQSAFFGSVWVTVTLLKSGVHQKVILI